jgi:hypothetical protein
MRGCAATQSASCPKERLKPTYSAAATPRSRPAVGGYQQSSQRAGTSAMRLSPIVWSTPQLQNGSVGKTITFKSMPARTIMRPRPANLRASPARLGCSAGPLRRRTARGMQKPTRNRKAGAANVMDT